MSHIALRVHEITDLLKGEVLEKVGGPTLKLTIYRPQDFQCPNCELACQREIQKEKYFMQHIKQIEEQNANLRKQLNDCKCRKK